MTEARILFESYRPGAPLRPWSTEPDEDTAMAAGLIVKASGAIDAVRHLIAGDPLSQEDRLPLQAGRYAPETGNSRKGSAWRAGLSVGLASQEYSQAVIQPLLAACT